MLELRYSFTDLYLFFIACIIRKKKIIQNLRFFLTFFYIFTKSLEKFWKILEKKNQSLADFDS